MGNPSPLPTLRGLRPSASLHPCRVAHGLETDRRAACRIGEGGAGLGYTFVSKRAQSPARGKINLPRTYSHSLATPPPTPPRNEIRRERRVSGPAPVSLFSLPWALLPRTPSPTHLLSARLARFPDFGGQESKMPGSVAQAEEGGGGWPYVRIAPPPRLK